MKFSVFILVMSLMGFQANAYVCNSLDGTQSFVTYFGHGQGWVDFRTSDVSFTGPINSQWVDKNQSVLLFTIATEDQALKLQLLQFRPDPNHTMTGILTMNGDSVVYSCE